MLKYTITNLDTNESYYPILNNESELDTLIENNKVLYGENYQVSFIDITEQHQQELELELELKKRASGSRVLAFINTVNNSKGYTSEQYLAMYQNQTIQFIKMMLENGALGSAIDTLALYVPDSLIDQDYKDRVSSFIQKEIDGL